MMNDLVVKICQRDDHISLDIRRNNKPAHLKTLSQEEKQSVVNMFNSVLKYISKC